MSDINLVEQLKGNLMRFRKDDLKTGKVEFEFFSRLVSSHCRHKVYKRATRILH
jgi:phosphoribosylformylglycinamidine (FGAM) synthase-like enzyme